MHQLIYALVQASSTEHALANARSVFDTLVGSGPAELAAFDYYVTFDNHDASFAGPARWGDLPVAARASTPAGAELIDRGWRATRDEFERNLTIAKEALAELTTDEIMHDADLVRHAFYNVGRYQGPTITLYDEHACGIRHRRKLNAILDTENLWVVPADVHY
ncbi:hypothetical protein [Haloarchaeobius amylolyticus]|uniref:hypothetical protein n=1 Tax=Haloarchaeobius amylolyticus TaxID=1198296 RepID=UPI00226D5BA0|nr:hypothetical protein [Haloarchaeobius amylolyticus]